MVALACVGLPYMSVSQYPSHLADWCLFFWECNRLKTSRLNLTPSVLAGWLKLLLMCTLWRDEHRDPDSSESQPAPNRPTSIKLNSSQAYLLLPWDATPGHLESSIQHTTPNSVLRCFKDVNNVIDARTHPGTSKQCKQVKRKRNNKKDKRR
jgi:hypothetical protein